MLKLKLKVDIEIEFPCIPTIEERDGEGRVGGRLLECHACLTFWPGAQRSAFSRKYGIFKPLTSRRLRVRCLGMTGIRICDLRSLGSWNIKKTDESPLEKIHRFL